MDTDLDFEFAKDGTVFRIHRNNDDVYLWKQEVNHAYGKQRESYEAKIKRLAAKFPAVAEAQAHLDELVALVEHE